ncbi:STAS domain-containing protein, partial [bacterium]|nr:STAS domain-containing protein [bacterium]
LGITTENALRQRVASLVEQSQVNLILDFTGVTFMDSSGMSSVLSAMRSVSENQGRICLVCDTRHILRVLRITAIDKLMAIYPTLDEAIAAFRSMPEANEG